MTPAPGRAGGGGGNGRACARVGARLAEATSTAAPAAAVAGAAGTAAAAVSTAASAPAPAPAPAAPDCLTVEEAALRDRIVRHVLRSGFRIGRDGRLRPGGGTRAAYRAVQMAAKTEQLRMHGRRLLSGAARAAAEKHCRDGSEIDPGGIRLEIRMVGPGDRRMAGLFQWWNLAWWSMPHQQAYGRQMRYFLWDVQHDAPFGMVGLQSPILRMGARDRYLGITRENAVLSANMSMSAQRIGALPPYNELIGGKMAALSTTCNEIRGEYRRRYGGRATVMRGRVIRAHMLFVTTTGAFGPSSMYDRLTYRGAPAAVHVGWTRGTGTFHLSNDAVRGLYEVAARRGYGTGTTYGCGPSPKVRVLKTALRLLGLGGFHMHGLRRSVYVLECAENVREVLGGGNGGNGSGGDEGDVVEPAWRDMPLADAAGWWKSRWCTGRAARRDAWRRFCARNFFDGVDADVTAAGRNAKE